MHLHKRGVLGALLFIQTTSILASDTNWYLKPIIGISQIADQKGQTTAAGNTDGPVSIDLDSGFTSGMAMGFNYNNGWSAEAAWEYRTNDSQSRLSDGTLFPEGNFASNVFFLNGYYHFTATGNWQPYLGAGLMFGQETDIDLESNGTEQSYTSDGDIGIQVMTGVKYKINDSWSLNGELRYGRFTELDLKGEGIVDLITELDYEPITLGLGLQYNF